LHDKIAEKNGKCNGIIIDTFDGKDAAFLPQSMFPVTVDYISHAHKDTHAKKPLPISAKLSKAVKENAQALRDGYFSGKKGETIFTDIVRLKNIMLDEQKSIRLSQDYQALATTHVDKLLFYHSDNLFVALSNAAIQLVDTLSLPVGEISIGAKVTDKIEIATIDSGDLSKTIEALHKNSIDVVVKQSDGTITIHDYIPSENANKESQVQDKESEESTQNQDEGR